ncbi:MAG: NAD(P)H-dependent oxidoreductase subunit E [Chloroflexi bacterium]|nr:NAD(P)H-dependent oxidoreductase subunit E [Chloroflexota bacterium]
MVAINSGTQEIVTQVAEVISPYSGRGDALITVLRKVQAKLGYLPERAISEVARLLRLSESEVYGVVTFYDFFRLRPAGANQISVCRGTACHVRGGPGVLDAARLALGIDPGEITSDGMYSLETVGCIGACVLAPNVVVNGQPRGKMTPKKTGELLSRLTSDGTVSLREPGAGRTC